MNYRTTLLAITSFLLASSQILGQENTTDATKKASSADPTKKWHVVVTYNLPVLKKEEVATPTEFKAAAPIKKQTTAVKSVPLVSNKTDIAVKKPSAPSVFPVAGDLNTFQISPVKPAKPNFIGKKNDTAEVVKKKAETKPPSKPAAGNGDWTKTWSVLAKLNTTFNSNLEHDPVSVKAVGFAPSLIMGYQLRSNDHRLRFIFGLSGSRYTRRTDQNRFGQYFGVSYRFSYGRWSLETEGEAILKGTNDDRETNNQFIATEKLSYKFNDKTKATLYYAYRLRRFPVIDADRSAVNPMYGFKLDRKLTDKLDWELGYRYDQNRAVNPRQNYIRSTYDTSFKYQLKKNDLLDTGFTFKPRLYSRLVNLGGGIRVPRQDKKYSFDISWRHNFDRWSFELGYGFEKQNSTDPDKIYRDHQIGFSISYHWGNGEVIEP